MGDSSFGAVALRVGIRRRGRRTARIANSASSAAWVQRQHA